MQAAPGEIDSHRPWIRDYRDDPGAMNWLATLFNPMGESTKLHFSRAWTFMFMGRVLLYIVPSFTAAVLGIAGVKTGFLNTPVNIALFTVPALLVPFAVFTFITDLTSFSAHSRRLAEAGRPTWLAVIVLVPMILGMAAYYAGTGMGAAQHRDMMKPPAAKTETPAKDGEAAAKDGEAEAKPKGEARRGPPGRQGPPPSEREMAVSTGMGMALPIWALASFGVMLWTLTYVARLPNGGQGRLRTGSHLTPDEIADGV
ncbi:MAG: hypothetical protein FP825_02350 [Hyphomonas sp.]|uniref:hypothetical protein n=1 Tax=Hyphomonas sp. TaxID=87 RepID=UPI0017BB4F94|nr:hypothetical protein [Hyphomonas sp.]MBU3919016.1 hypothetical protein [Alphaproteobacteria bacterium]MBA3067305.1 hypothetical protein [Hyphomonas sp.]MBU4062994.1 hypothetical protein [Alphaproteobacteria bacterium]MBU4163575.1 hypothetical protein [Alphaproteobacteria bacterium]MBU4568021.1 hypothetical protein [Alphaproteobacteria bacterium]